MKNENFGANLWGNFCSITRNKNFRFGSKFGPNNLRTLKTYKKEEDLYKNITQPPNQESQFLAPKSQSKWCHRRVNIPPPKNLRTLSKSPLCDKCERFASRNTKGGGALKAPRLCQWKNVNISEMSIGTSWEYCSSNVSLEEPRNIKVEFEVCLDKSLCFGKQNV